MQNNGYTPFKVIQALVTISNTNQKLVRRMRLPISE